MKRESLIACALAIGISLHGTSEAQLAVCDRLWCGAVDYAVGSNPSGVAAADFDGDRRVDLAVTSESPDKVGVLRNVGNGTFAAPVNVALAGGSGPHSLAAADFDGDGDVDLVVTRHNENDVQLLINTSGVFSLGAITGVDGTDPRQIVAGDLDNNGFVDVVTVNRGSDSISVLLNSGGALATAVTYPVGADPRSLALGYLDSNAGLDLAVASHGDREVELYLNDGSGVFAAGSSLFVGASLRPEGVAIGDLDADGDSDIASSTTATVGGFVSVFLNSGSATFGAPVHHDSEATDPSSIVIADFDLAFGNDIAVLNGDIQNPITGDIESLVAVLSNLGAADFGLPRLLEVGESPAALAVADLFTNGAFHLVSANRDEGTISILKNNNVILASGFEWGDTFPWSRTVPELP
ncbi:MAG: VCBS repeat-containing protein [Thermoanaerobaculia bacterium]